MLLLVADCLEQYKGKQFYVRERIQNQNVMLMLFLLPRRKKSTIFTF